MVIVYLLMYVTHLTLDKDTIPELNEQASLLLKEVLKDQNISNDLSKYYQVMAFVYSLYGKVSVKYKDEEAINLAKAIKLNPSAIPLSDKEVNHITKLYKNKAALSVKEMRAAIKDRVNNERANEIPPIGISLSNIAIILSIISTIVVISGYYYIKQLLGHFGLNSSDFYSLNDYTSASLDYAVTTFNLDRDWCSHFSGWSLRPKWGKGFGMSN